jgi:hypothetical protein
MGARQKLNAWHGWAAFAAGVGAATVTGSLSAFVVVFVLVFVLCIGNGSIRA